MSESETTQASSGATDAPARKADVMPTAVTQIAQACANAICDEFNVGYTIYTLNGPEFRETTAAKVAVCIANTLNAIRETLGEGTKPNA